MSHDDWKYIELVQSSAALLYRQRQPEVDVSGAICGFGEWSEWERVPFQPELMRMKRSDLIAAEETDANGQPAQEDFKKKRG